MSIKSPKVLIIISFLTFLSISIFFVAHERSKSSSTEKNTFLPIKIKEPFIRGFQYSGFLGGRKTITIKAAKFSIQKKKFGLFKLSPLKIAMFRGAEIDLFGETVQQVKGRSQLWKASMDKENSPPTKNEISFKRAISRETLPSAMLKGGVSAICKPVKINLYVDDALLTKIQADKAIVDPRKRRMILRHSIQVTSGSSHLVTDRLTIYPEAGLFEVENNYVLKTQEEAIRGEKLTTDFSLRKVNMQ